MGSRRTALQQFWTTTPTYSIGLGTTTVGRFPRFVQSDGSDVWVANEFSGTLSRVRGSDGKLLDTWTGATLAGRVLVAMGRVFVLGITSPGTLFMIDPTAPGGPVTLVTSALGNLPAGIAFDGSRIWTANVEGSVSIVTPSATMPWPTVSLRHGFISPFGLVFDGSNIWCTDGVANRLLKLDHNGDVVLTLPVGSSPGFPAFDGTNIWVPNGEGTLSVVQAATGTVIATLTGNGLNRSNEAAFDGQRILVTNPFVNSVSLWQAANLTPIGALAVGDFVGGACSDGINFWITLANAGQLARF